MALNGAIQPCRRYEISVPDEGKVWNQDPALSRLSCVAPSKKMPVFELEEGAESESAENMPLDSCSPIEPAPRMYSPSFRLRHP
eukprot:447158-Hanusia_phi.AAC.2